MFKCGAPPNELTFKRNKVCDGVYDCVLGEDELGCDKSPVCDQTYIRLETVSYANEIQFSVSSGLTFGDTSRMCYIEDKCTPVQTDNAHHLSICNTRTESLKSLPYGNPARDETLCEAGGICAHTTNECTSEGTPAGCCPTVDEEHHCSDGGMYCDTFTSKMPYKLPLYLAPGLHTIHAKDLAGDGWGTGATFAILQLNPKTKRENEVRRMTVAEVSSISTTGTDLSFNLECAASTETSQSECLEAQNTWDTSVTETCVTTTPCSGTATDAVAFPSCATAFLKASRGVADLTSACPPGCTYAGPDIMISNAQGIVKEIDAGAENTVTLSNPGIAIVVGQRLRVVDASGQTCAVTPKVPTCTGTATDATATPNCATALAAVTNPGATACPAGCTYTLPDLIVESVSACGSVIKFTTDITAGDANARTRCRVVTECGAADLSGGLSASRTACSNVGGSNSGRCLYQAAAAVCRATNKDNADIEKTCSDGTTKISANAVCDGHQDCPANPSCVPISAAPVTAVDFETSVTASARIHTIVMTLADPSIVPGQSIQLASAQGATCAAAPLNSDLTVESVCGAVVKIKTATPLTAGDTVPTNCVVPRTAAADCIEDEMCSFSCGDPPCNIDLVGFPANPDGCTPTMQGDGTCDPVCFTASCNFDATAGGSGDCEQCDVGCYEWLRGDGTCNPECATPACNYDAPAVDVCADAKHSANQNACITVTDGDNGHAADHQHSKHTVCVWDSTNNVCSAKPDCNPDIDTLPTPDTCTAAVTTAECTACNSAIGATRDSAGCVLGNQCERGIDCGSALDSTTGSLYGETQCDADAYCAWSGVAACVLRGRDAGNDNMCLDADFDGNGNTGCAAVYSEAHAPALRCGEFSFDQTGFGNGQCDWVTTGTKQTSDPPWDEIPICRETTAATCAAISQSSLPAGSCTFAPSMCAGVFPAMCHGSDDGAGTSTACTLNADSSACAVQGGNCLYTAGGSCEASHCGQKDDFRFNQDFGSVHQCRATTSNGCQSTDGVYNPTDQPASCVLECGSWNPAWDSCVRSVATCSSPCQTVSGRVTAVTGGTGETCAGTPDATCTGYAGNEGTAATCIGSDDGNSVACALSADQSACAVTDAGHNCVHNAASPSANCPDNCVLAGVPGVGTGETCTVKADCTVGYIAGSLWNGPSTTCPTGCTKVDAGAYSLTLAPTADGTNDDWYNGWSVHKQSPSQLHFHGQF